MLNKAYLKTTMLLLDGPIGASLCDGTNPYHGNRGLNVHIFAFSGSFQTNKVSNPIVLIPREPLEVLYFALKRTFCYICNYVN